MKIDTIQAEVDKLTEALTITHIKDTVTIMSPYALSEAEIAHVKNTIHGLENIKLVNIVDKELLSGIIVKIGTRMYDLSLNGILQSLRKQIYESN